jgi:hypothetical protein
MLRFRHIRFLLLFLVPEALLAQTSGTALQTITLAIQPILRMQVSGNPEPLTVSRADAGSEPEEAKDENTAYSIVTNMDNVKIVASISDVMPAGTKLSIALQSTRGTSRGRVDISRATSPVEVVTNILRGAERDRRITYYFGATAEAGEISHASRNVTLTLTN